MESYKAKNHLTKVKSGTKFQFIYKKIKKIAKQLQTTNKQKNTKSYGNVCNENESLYL